MIKLKISKTQKDKLKPIQYTKKLVTLIMIATFLLSCFGVYINYKNGYSLDAIALKWIDFAIWIGGIYLGKAFAEKYAEEKNNLEREVLKNKIDVTDKDTKQTYKDVEI